MQPNDSSNRIRPIDRKHSNNEPWVTIITAVYNSVQQIESTILSILDQPYQNIDYIIIDGGSKDGTLDIIKKYDDNITYWVSEPDNGIYDAFNKGWNAARKDSYILYLGAGDKIISLPKSEMIQNSQVLFGRVIMDDTTVFQSKFDFRLKLGNTLHHQSLLVKKSLFPFSPFNLNYKTYADFDFNQRLLKENIQFQLCEDFVAYALPGGVSQNFNFKESLSIVKKNFGIAVSVLACSYYLFQYVRNKLAGQP